MQRVGFLPRLGAFLIDLGLFAAAVHLFTLVDVLINMRNSVNNFGFVSLLGGALLLIGYGFCEALMGATPGKRIAGLVIAAEGGQPAARKALLKRWAAKQVPVFFAAPTAVCWTLISPYNYHVPLPDFVALGVLVLAVIDTILTGLLLVMVAGGCFLALGPSRLTLHDKLAGTAVYRAAELFAPLGCAGVMGGGAAAAEITSPESRRPRAREAPIPEAPARLDSAP
jgi:uncharacterized RDD family membrane protein YckC